MFQEFPEDNKSDDFLNEFRQKIADQSASSFEEKRNELKRSKSVFIGAVSGIALAGIVGWFVLAPRYEINNPAEIPVIRRPQTAIKLQPSEPGGMEILNQDKSVYDIIEKKSGNEPVVENLLPPPEEPRLQVIEATTPVAPQTQPQAQPHIAEQVAQIGTSTAIKDAQKIIDSKDTPEDDVVSIKEASMEKITVIEPVQHDIINIGKNKPAIEIQKPLAPSKDWSLDAANAPANQASAPQGADSDIPVGSWQVQLMSSPNKKAIESAWNMMVKKYAILKNQPHEIETADLDFDGVFYRLKTGTFKDKSGADTLCRDIKTLGGTCIVKKK